MKVKQEIATCNVGWLHVEEGNIVPELERLQSKWDLLDLMDKSSVAPERYGDRDARRI